MVTAVSPAAKTTTRQPVRLSVFASVKLTVSLLVTIAICVLLGAWCPQEAQVGREKVIEAFGPQFASKLIEIGVADIFHTPFFLGLIGLLTVNMIACSMQRVFPKVRSLVQPMAFLDGAAISKLGLSHTRAYDAPPDVVMQSLQGHLRRSGYCLDTGLPQRNQLFCTAHWGKWGRLAPTITHIGLLTLLSAVTITSWTGFTGFQAVPQKGLMHFEESQHSKLWMGKLPEWRIRVDATRRENYPSGDPKQWYSDLSVVDPSGRVLQKQQISVNNPLSFQGVDIYQSSWGLQSIAISFGGKRVELPLRQMGPVIHAAFLPLDSNTIMMFSVHGMDQPVRVFAKVPQWQSPRILTVLTKGQPMRMGSLEVVYDELIPVTGLQYKSDPGLLMTYVAFGFIICGVLLAAVPHRQVWINIYARPEGGCRLSVGGMSRKARTAFARSLDRLVGDLDKHFPSLTHEEPLCPISSQC